MSIQDDVVTLKEFAAWIRDCTIVPRTLIVGEAIDRVVLEFDVLRERLERSEKLLADCREENAQINRTDIGSAIDYMYEQHKARTAQPAKEKE